MGVENLALVRKQSISQAKTSAYAAAIWAFLFAAISFYWALGGTTGADTLGTAFSDPDTVETTAFTAVLWITAILKTFLGILALMLAATWGEGIFRLLLLIAGWGTGIVLFLYGVALFIQHGLMAADVIDIPSAIGSITAVRWHLLVWDPYWFLGGVLFIRAAKAFRRAWK